MSQYKDRSRNQSDLGQEQNFISGTLISFSGAEGIIKRSDENPEVRVKLAEFSQSGFPPEINQRLRFRTYGASGKLLCATDIKLFKLELVKGAKQSSESNAEVLWFNIYLGYGFIRPDDYSGSEGMGVHVHINLLDKSGINPRKLSPTTRVWVETRLSRTSNKFYVSKILLG